MHVLLWRARRGQLGGEWDVERVRESPEDAAGRSALILFGWVVGGGLRAANPHFSGATLLRFTFQSLSGGLRPGVSFAPQN
jgi:hypothetical protein